MPPLTVSPSVPLSRDRPQPAVTAARVFRPSRWQRPMRIV
jgi:hypothetical protein